MKDEIKEILDKLKNIHNFDYSEETDSKGNVLNKSYDIYLSKEETDKLLDYISNLQEENENRISESLSYDLAVARIKELEQKINGLQEERNYLYNKLSSENEHIHNYYKSRIDKAIEYIENENICREELPKYARIEINNFDKKYRNDLLNILQGGDEE